MRYCVVRRLILVATTVAGAMVFASAAGGVTITGEALARELASPRAIFLDRAVVKGPLNLQQIGVVRAAFECRSCTFAGGIRARHVVFEREIDLGGAHVHGPLDFDSASFRGAIVLGSGVLATRVQGRVDFRLATFADVMDAEHVSFRRKADFGLARFRGEAIFTGATFRGTAHFAGASFDQRVRFDGGSFTRDANFTRAIFGSTVDFRSRVFNRGQFANVDFRGLADFGQATFKGVAEFDETRFEEDATFRGATFKANANPDDDRALSLGYVVSQEKLDFGSATFKKFVFAENVVARALSFDDVTFVDPAQITLARLRVGDLEYPLGDVSRVADDAQQRDVLRQIESSAKNRGDIALANDARYQLQTLAARGYSGAEQVLDTVFYRWIAGYFVRPLQPLAVLVGLVLALSLVRWFSRTGGAAWKGLRGAWAWIVRVAPRRARDAASNLRRAWLWLVGLASKLFDTFALAVPRLRGGDDQAQARGMGRRLEILAYRLLIVCALLGLANSNPTLRQMFDALT